MSRGCSTICSHPVWSVDVPIVSGPGRPYSNSLVSNWVPPPQYPEVYWRGIREGERREGDPSVLRGRDPEIRVLCCPRGDVVARYSLASGVCCTVCNTAGVQREDPSEGRRLPRARKEIERQTERGRQREMRRRKRRRRRERERQRLE